MTRWSSLHPLTRTLLWVLALHVGLALVLTAAGYETLVRYVARVVLWRALDDSWDPMRQALAYVRSPGPAPLYEVVFFQRGVIFTYPTASLFLLEAVGWLTRQPLPSDAVLNAVSWCATILTLAVAGQLLLESARVHLPDRAAPRGTERWVLWGLGAALTLVFYPVPKAFALGQVQTLVTAAVVCGLLAWVRGREAWAGACCALACLVKPQVGLLVAWALLRRRWRFAGAWMVVVAILGGWSVARYGVANQVDYLRELSFITAHSWSYAPNQSVAGIVNRALFIGTNLEWDPRYVSYNPWVYGATVGSSLILVAIGLLAGVRGHKADDRSLSGPTLALLCFTMASPVAWEHHYGLAVPAYAWLAPKLVADTHSGRLRIWLLVSFLLAASLLHPLDALAPTAFNVLQNNLFAGAVILVGLLWWALRQEGHGRRPSSELATASGGTDAAGVPPREGR